MDTNYDFHEALMGLENVLESTMPSSVFPPSQTSETSDNQTCSQHLISEICERECSQYWSTDDINTEEKLDYSNSIIFDSGIDYPTSFVNSTLALSPISIPPKSPIDETSLRQQYSPNSEPDCDEALYEFMNNEPFPAIPDASLHLYLEDLDDLSPLREDNPVENFHTLSSKSPNESLFETGDDCLRTLTPLEPFNPPISPHVNTPSPQEYLLIEPPTQNFSSPDSSHESNLIVDIAHESVPSPESSTCSTPLPVQSPIPSCSQKTKRSRKRKLSDESIRDSRKKVQNKEAARRYREKRKNQENAIGDEEAQLLVINNERKEKVKQLTETIKLLKDLMSEFLNTERKAIIDRLCSQSS